MTVSFGLLALAWLQNLYVPPWLAWHSEIYAFFAAFLSAVWLLMGARGRLPKTINIPLFAWSFVFLTAVVGIQFFAGLINFGGDALVLVFYLALCLVSITIGFHVGNVDANNVVRRELKGIATIQMVYLILLGGVFSSVVACVQAFDVWAWASWILRMPSLYRSGANLGQPNQLATLLLFSIASLTFLYESRRMSSTAATPIAALLLIGLGLTASRSGALSMFLMAGWWWVSRRRIGFTLSRRMVCFWLGFFAISFWYGPSLINLIQNGEVINSSESMVNTSLGTRLLVWPQLWQAVLLRPMFGWGLGGVSTAQNAVLDAFSESESFSYAHNIVLDLAVGIGLPLTILLVGAAIVWLWRRGRAANDVAAWYFLATLLPFGVHSMFEFPFAYAYFLFPVMFLLGSLEARLAPSSVVGIPSWAAVTAWVLVSVVMVWSVLEYLTIEEDFRVVRFEAIRIGRTPSEYERPKIVLLSQFKALLEGARIVPTPKMDAQRIELSRKVALRFPWTATQNRYALSLALNGNTDEAIRQLKVMRAMHGEKAYDDIRANWSFLAANKYPQLSQIKLP